MGPGPGLGRFVSSIRLRVRLALVLVAGRASREPGKRCFQVVCRDVLKSRKAELLIPNDPPTSRNSHHVRICKRLRLGFPEGGVNVIKEQTYDIAVGADANRFAIIPSKYVFDSCDEPFLGIQGAFASRHREIEVIPRPAPDITEIIHDPLDHKAFTQIVLDVDVYAGFTGEGPDRLQASQKGAGEHYLYAQRLKQAAQFFCLALSNGT